MIIASDSIVKPHNIQKANRLSVRGGEGVRRLAAFVGCASLDPWDIYCACERGREAEVEARRARILQHKLDKRASAKKKLAGQSELG